MNTLFIYPNPVRRGRSVSASFNSEHDGSALLLIYDQSLQLIKQLPTIQISSGQPYDWTIQTSDMPLGLMEILLVIQPQAGQSFKKAKSLMITD